MPDTLSVHLPPFDYNDDPMAHGAGRTARVERLQEPWKMDYHGSNGCDQMTMTTIMKFSRKDPRRIEELVVCH